MNGESVEWSTTKSIDETVDSCGRVHERYFSASRRIGCDLLKPSHHLRKSLSTGRPLGDDLRIYPIPLILPKCELSQIRRGAEQRLLAMAYFFEDLVIRNQRCFHERKISRAEVHSVLHDSGWTLSRLKHVWEGKKFRDISILSGPDLVRTPAHTWAVIEDNLGGTDRMLGGIADIQFAHPVFLRSPLAKLNGFRYPKPLAQFLTRWRDLHSIEDSTLLVAIGLQGLLSELKRIPDKEEFRVWEIIRSVFPEARPYGELFLSLLAPLRVRREKVQDTCRAVLNLGPDCRTAIHPHFVSYFRKGSIPFFAGMGTEILANKGLLPFVDLFIKYYLGEDPIIPTVQTRTVDPSQFLFERMSSKVAKRANGIQGTSVLIFPRMRLRKRRKVFQVVQRQFQYAKRTSKKIPLWVEQEYVPASFIRDSETGRKMEINIRPFAYLIGGTVQGSSVPWGRIGSRSPQPLVNISQGAQQLVVLAGSSSRGAKLINEPNAVQN